MNMIKRFLQEESGATAVEYALMVALIAVAVAVTVFLLGQEIEDRFDDVLTCISAPDSDNCAIGSSD